MEAETEIIGQVVETKVDLIIVKSKVRGLIKASECNTSEEAYAVIDASLKEIVEKAIGRAKANGRKTVKARDI